MRDKLKQDSIDSLKAHNQARVDVLRFLISLIDKRELQLPPGSMTETEVLSVMRKELKNKEESREMFLKGNRDDLVKSLDYEMSVLKEYLPADISDDNLVKFVDEAIASVGNNFGLVMREVLKKAEGKVGGDRVSKIVKEKLG
ncbi:GatB/YqeY domain-containing protein [Candidatus Shapirobacteria bacterium]|nr:GatB/YqeY domain-containing protein [Candidatus Shapirobacteria bacterium]